jgi:hypothetical protein
LVDYWVGEDPWNGPDPDLTRIGEDEAFELAARYRAEL